MKLKGKLSAMGAFVNKELKYHCHAERPITIELKLKTKRKLRKQLQPSREKKQIGKKALQSTNVLYVSIKILSITKNDACFLLFSVYPLLNYSKISER